MWPEEFLGWNLHGSKPFLIACPHRQIMSHIQKLKIITGYGLVAVAMLNDAKRSFGPHRLLKNRQKIADAPGSGHTWPN